MDRIFTWLLHSDRYLVSSILSDVQHQRVLFDEGGTCGEYCEVD